MSADPGSVVAFERTGRVTTVTMNRPKVLNVLDETLARELLDAFRRAARDPETRVVVLKGAGRSFMAGGDLARFHADLPGAPETAASLIGSFHALMRQIAEMPQIVIAAVQGPVAGGGVGLALACDLVVASEEASFLSAYTKLGTSPDGGTTWSLTHLLGAKRALDLVLFNEPISAAEALRLGLIGRVLPSAELEAGVAALAERLCASAHGASIASKRLVRAAASGSFDAQLDLERDAFIRNAGTADFAEGIRAFVEKRRAVFGGPR